ncbi:DUF3857 domain-containing protein [Teredinibacter waterburyi]|uniref:DUF3857 domain-containing protein n=1 Tax=Teredinibacter waterburyi TaxID=1500538 RepID=UPI00165EE8FC|nr:DUF3857 domain-containing protein [Teredinibacter waterburyi]
MLAGPTAILGFPYFIQRYSARLTSLCAGLLALALYFPLASQATVLTPTTSLAPPLSKQAKLRSKQPGAEVLYSIQNNTLDTEGSWTRQSYYSIRINDQEAARDYGRLSITYNHYYSEASLDFANVLTADGKLKTVSEDAIQIRVTGGGQDFYNDRSEIVFSLPEIAPGATIELQFTTKTLRRAITTVDNDGARPYWFQQRVALDGWRGDAVRNFSYSLTVPETLALLPKVFGTFNSTPKTTVTDANIKRVWEWKNIPPVTLEARMPALHKISPSIQVSTSNDWSLIDAWTWQKVENKLTETEPLRAALSTLALSPHANKDEKIRAVYTYMQSNIRYVFAHLGRGGYEPHTPDEALEQGYGDCKDQTVLAVALLRALGVEAYPVLVETPNSGKSDGTLVSLIFDHMLVWIPASDDGPETWMDTTGDRAMFPGFSNLLVGQPALIVNGRGGVFKPVDAKVEPNIAELQLEYKQDNKNRSIVTATYKGTGIYEQNLRNWWKHDTNRESSLPQFLAGIFDNSGQYTLSSEVLNSENINTPTQVNATFTFAPEEGDAPTTYGASFFQVYRLVGELSSMQIPSTRKNRWINPLPQTFRITALFKGQANTIPTVVSTSKNIKTDYFTLTQTGKTEGNDYSVTIEFYQPALNLSVAQYGDYFNALTALKELKPWLVSMQPDTGKQRDKTLASVAVKFGESTFEYKIAQAKNHLEKGDFDLALIKAEEAVAIAPESGEAWYVLGSAQGFNALIDESSHSFNKAKTLGYLP